MFTEGLEFFIWSRIFPDGLTSFQIAWNFFRWSGMFSFDLKSFQIALKMLWVAWKIYKWFFKNFPDLLPCFFGFSASAVLISRAFTKDTLSLPIPQNIRHEISWPFLLSSSEKLPCYLHWSPIARSSLSGRVCSSSSATSSL